MPQAAVSTKTQIEALEPKATTYPVPVKAKHGSAVRGLAVQVTPAGFKSFVLRFRLHGRQKTTTLGKFPDMSIEKAIAAAVEKWTEIQGGSNPSDRKRSERKATTVKELVADFKVKHLDAETSDGRKISKGWSTESKRLLDNFIVPTLGSMRVKDVEKSDVAEMLYQIARDTPVQANRVRSVCSKLFTKAELWGLRAAGTNPARGQDREAETSKDRYLSDIELVRLGVVIRALTADRPTEANLSKGLVPVDAQALAAVRLLLLTGMRKSELIGDKPREIPALQWTDVDLDARLIIKKVHKTRKKTGSIRVIPLCSQAVEMLKNHKKTSGNPHVIVGNRTGQSLVGLQDEWELIRTAVNTVQKNAKVPKKFRVNIEDVTIHDLRRTFGSVGTAMKYPLPFISGLLGHAASTVTEVYAQVGGDPLHDAAEAIGTRIAGLLDGTIDPLKESADRRQELDEMTKLKQRH